MTRAAIILGAMLGLAACGPKPSTQAVTCPASDAVCASLVGTDAPAKVSTEGGDHEL